MADDQPRVFTRRDLLRGAGLAGAAALIPAAAGEPRADAAAAAPPGAQTTSAAALPVESLETLTAAEAEVLEAIVARLIPTDELGPGAREARAAHYIDRALGGALAASRPAYTSGLEALDRYARAAKGRAFAQLSPADQDAVLTDVERGSATGFTGNPVQFFNMVLNHTRQGTFGDPYYGGNANFVGWDLLGYPGVRTQVTAADQKLLEEGALKPNHKSAYDSPMFNKATASLDPAHEDEHTQRASHHGD